MKNSFHSNFRYKVLNIESSSTYKGYSDKIPEFLHNRPKYIVKHVMGRMPTDPPHDVVIMKKDQQSIVSGGDEGRKYCINLGCAEILPSCQCMDFQKNKMLCKHICAVISQPEIGWESLGTSFKEHPLFKLDPVVLSQVSGRELTSIEKIPSESQSKKRKSDSNQLSERTECLKKIKYLTDEIYALQDAATLNAVDSLLEEAISIARKKTGGSLEEKSLPPEPKKKKKLLKKALTKKSAKRYGARVELEKKN